MKYYRMKYKMDWTNWDGGEAMVLLRRSHDFVETKTGLPLVDYSSSDTGEPVTGPFICDLDDEDQTNRFPTFFTSPAFITTKQFYEDLTATGVDNVETFPVIIKDKVNDREVSDYVLLNIIGRVSCAVMDESDADRLNDTANENDFVNSMYIINQPVIDSKRAQSQDLFVLHEDTDVIIVSEKVADPLRAKGYQDVEFEELVTK